jgi:glutathione S-transferase
MKLFFSPNSPYVRKCLVTAEELGLADLIELLPVSPHPVARDQSIVINNPLGKIPTLITRDGQPLYDSRVICEYLNSVGQGNLIPIENTLRWDALTLQSLGDGILDAALLIRYETNVRPDTFRWSDWISGKLDAIHTSLTYLDQHPKVFNQAFHLGLLTIGCALWYLDLRYPELDWRNKYPQLAKVSENVLNRPSLQRNWTMPV